jgi:hypothetical protein
MTYIESLITLSVASNFYGTVFDSWELDPLTDPDKSILMENVLAMGKGHPPIPIVIDLPNDDDDHPSNNLMEMYADDDDNIRYDDISIQYDNKIIQSPPLSALCPIPFTPRRSKRLAAMPRVDYTIFY